MNNELLRAIDTMNIDELRRVTDAVRARERTLSAAARDEFSFGDLVQFMTRTRGLVFGKIIGVNTKTIKVIDTMGTRWRVAPSLLQRRNLAIGEK